MASKQINVQKVEDDQSSIELPPAQSSIESVHVNWSRPASGVTIGYVDHVHKHSVWQTSL